MNNDYTNPYAATAVPSHFAQGSDIDPESLKKIEAIIKDANQFWLAILLCFLCSGVGGILIGPWYMVRLIQWNKMSQSQPALLESAAPPGSLPRQFQSAKTKLIIGMVVGASILVLAFLVAGLSVVSMPVQARP
jgi:hypothetical protein